MSLSTLTESYGFLSFMDSAKSKYIVFLPEILKHLDVGGVVVLDDIFQRLVMLLRILWKSVVVSELFTEDFKDYLMQPRQSRTHRNTSTSGDGILMLRKKCSRCSNLPDSE